MSRRSKDDKQRALLLEERRALLAYALEVGVRVCLCVVRVCRRVCAYCAPTCIVSVVWRVRSNGPAHATRGSLTTLSLFLSRAHTPRAANHPHHHHHPETTNHSCTPRAAAAGGSGLPYGNIDRRRERRALFAPSSVVAPLYGA